MKYIVGQSLYWSGRNNLRNHGPVTVTKVGRKWVYLSNEQRINPVTMWADGGNYTTPGRCYLSKEDHDEDVLRWRLETRLRIEVGNRFSSKIPSQDIVAAGKLLGFDLEALIAKGTP